MFWRYLMKSMTSTTRNLLGIEGTKSQEGLSHHVGGQPVSVVVLGLIPEEFLLGSDRIDRLDQTPRE